MTAVKDDFDIYVERYSKCYHITPEEALKHKLVQDVRTYYLETGRITETR